MINEQTNKRRRTEPFRTLSFLDVGNQFTKTMFFLSGSIFFTLIKESQVTPLAVAVKSLSVVTKATKSLIEIIWTLFVCFCFGVFQGGGRVGLFLLISKEGLSTSEINTTSPCCQITFYQILT